MSSRRRWPRRPTAADVGDGDRRRHPHESPWLMTLPLVVLAGCCGRRALNLPFTQPARRSSSTGSSRSSRFGEANIAARRPSTKVVLAWSP